jgi:hypothetical protein
MIDYKDYGPYLKFIETFAPQGFEGIDSDHPLMLELEKMMETNDQFFYIADAVQMKIKFTSRRSTLILGIPPDELSFYHFMEAVHPDDMQRLNLGRARLLKIAQELFIAQKGTAILSTNFRFRNVVDGYSSILCQNYLFYTTVPYKTVFFLKVHTNIDWGKKMKKDFHYYLGNDLNYFKFPDAQMLQTGVVFSGRELEIIRLVEQGLSTEKIAEKLFISPYTVNTHRGNILQKSGKPHISDVIYDLQQQGLL